MGETDPYNITEEQNSTVYQYVKTHNETCILANNVVEVRFFITLTLKANIGQDEGRPNSSSLIMEYDILGAEKGAPREES